MKEVDNPNSNNGGSSVPLDPNTLDQIAKDVTEKIESE